ncbi:NAD(P)/FAD-dependent oxidoreductase [Taklimakanibacter lacteus]|uniref:NAD(P)/FAD-dependent oxidoreductase n=1 Tax=Taklimakanibacter lacteus TaxID=2268456 RepID=UPI000E661584
MSFAVEIIGAGPSGLMAAEVLATAGARVRVVDHMASPARKFLMAGRGGLNLTHSEPLDQFLDRYGAARSFLEPAIRAFPPEALIGWCNGLGIETFVGSSGRVFPTTMKASPLLRAWLRRLDALGVKLELKTEWMGEKRSDAMILALGGASWPRLGSDAHWVDALRRRGVPVNDFVPANCGIGIAWSPYFRERFAGEPLKRIRVTSGVRGVRGEAMITARGLEGGAIYALSRELRQTGKLTLDLRPDLSIAALEERLARPRGKDSRSNRLRKAANLSPAAIALLREAGAPATAHTIKAVELTMTGTDLLARAISSAGGVALDAVDSGFALKAWPGVHAVGEMLDWEAPTGGYLLQACFSTAVAAAKACLEALQTAPDRPQSLSK